MSRRTFINRHKIRLPLAELIRDARRRAGLTQEQVSETLGYASGGQFVSNWERALAIPPVAAAPILCHLLKLDRGTYYRAFRAALVAEVDARVEPIRPRGVHA